MTPQAVAYIERIDVVEGRLAEHASARHEGLTPPHPGDSERWAAGDIWAHMAEFVSYWIPQVEVVIDDFRDEPVPFGRTKRDPDRIAAIAGGRDALVADLWVRVRGDLVTLRSFLASLEPGSWAAVGLHPTLGSMPLPSIIHEFLVGHLEEHAAQLDLLNA